MPPKGGRKAAAARHHDAATTGPTGGAVVRSESLLASEMERSHTSKSLYGDHKARVSSNVYALNDHVRNNAFGGFLKRCARGKSVLNLGCGIGLWAMTAAKAHASTVVAVDTSAIIDSARVVAEQNKFANVVFIQGKVRDGSARLPQEKFDIIVCDWVGQFGTNEPLFKEFAYCVKHHLAEGGVVCPNVASIHVAGITDYLYYQETVGFWDNVYGFQMKPMQKLVTSEPTSGAIPKSHFATDVFKVASIDVAALDTSALKPGLSDDDAAYAALAGYEGPFVLNVTRKATLHFLTFFVDCRFTNAADAGANFVIGFAAGGRNSWSEVSAFLPEPLPVFAGDVVKGHVKVVPRNGHTELVVNVTVKNAIVDHTSTTTHRFQY